MLKSKQLCFVNVYQALMTSYRTPGRATGKTLLNSLIDRLQRCVPKALVEVRTLGRRLHKRREGITAYFDHPHTSNGPTEAIQGRLEHLRGTALGFRNLGNYFTRALLDTGGFRPQLHCLSLLLAGLVRAGRIEAEPG